MKKNAISRYFALPFAFVLGIIAGHAHAQGTTYADDYWLDWQEDEVTSFPDFDPKRALPIEVNVHSQLQWTIDPQTISIGKDSVVRYVVIGTSATGTINAMYEGVLCREGIYKVYARAINEAPWRATNTKEWSPLQDAPALGHERMIAQNYACEGNSRPRSVRAIIAHIRSPYASVRP